MFSLLSIVRPYPTLSQEIKPFVPLYLSFGKGLTTHPINEMKVATSISHSLLLAHYDFLFQAHIPSEAEVISLGIHLFNLARGKGLLP